MKLQQMFEPEGLAPVEPILAEIHQIMIDLRLFLRSTEVVADPLRSAELALRLERLAFVLTGSVLERLVNGYQLRDSLINRVTGKSSRWIQARLQFAFIAPDLVNAFTAGYIQTDHVEALMAVESEIDRATLIELVKRERLNAVRLQGVITGVFTPKSTEIFSS